MKSITRKGTEQGVTPQLQLMSTVQRGVDRTGGKVRGRSGVREGETVIKGDKGRSSLASAL